MVVVFLAQEWPEETAKMMPMLIQACENDTPELAHERRCQSFMQGMKDACTDVDTASGEHCEATDCLDALVELADAADEQGCAEFYPENTAPGLRAVCRQTINAVSPSVSQSGANAF
jgi:hypothetical protein